jgi:hypothetical protein
MPAISLAGMRPTATSQFDCELRTFTFARWRLRVDVVHPSLHSARRTQLSLIAAGLTNSPIPACLAVQRICRQPVETVVNGRAASLQLKNDLLP